MPQRRCSKCKRKKPATTKYFNVKNSTRSGLGSWCKVCCKENQAEKYKEDTRRFRGYDFKKCFGITIEQYEKLFNKQKGLCAICHQTEKKKGVKWLAVDHCHDSKKVRGLLCNNCNNGLGRFKHSIEFLKSAVKYLRKSIP